MNTLLPSGHIRPFARLFSSSKAQSKIPVLALAIFLIAGLAFLFFLGSSTSPTGMVVIGGDNASFVYDGPDEIFYSEQAVMDLSYYFNQTGLTFLVTGVEGANVSLDQSTLMLLSNSSLASYEVTVIASIGEEFLSVPLTFTNDNTEVPTELAHPFSDTQFDFEDKDGVPLDPPESNPSTQSLTYSHQPLDLVGVESRIVLAGVTPFSSSVKARIGSTTVPDYMQTEIFAINDIEAESAQLTLATYGEVEEIFRCSDYNTDLFSCNGFWGPTGIPFTQNSTHVSFTATQFSAYGGVGSTGGFETLADNFVNVTACGTLNQNTTIISDINETGGCFTLNRSNIALNCRGHTIRFATSGVNNVAGLRAANHTNITISNCNFVDGNATGSFTKGILITNTSNVTIYNNSITLQGIENNPGILVAGFSQDVIIRSNNVTSVTTDNGSVGIALYESYNVTLDDNTITAGGVKFNKGVLFSNSSYNNTIFNNSIAANGTNESNFGVYFFNASDNFILYNVIESRNSTTQGNALVLSSFSDNNLVRLNDIYSQSNTLFEAVRLEGNVSGSEILNNTIVVNGTNASWARGLVLTQNTTNTFIANNTLNITGISHNNTGVLLYSDVFFTTIENNTFIVDTLGGYQRGVHLFNQSSNNTFRFNTLWINGSIGHTGITLELGSVGNMIYNNSVTVLSENGSSTAILLAGSVNESLIENNTFIVSSENASGNAGLLMLDNSSRNNFISNTIDINGSAQNIGLRINASSGVNNTYRSNFVLVNGTSQNFGIYLGAGNQTLINNTIITDGESGNNHGLFVTQADNVIEGTHISTSGNLSHGVFLLNSLGNAFISTNLTTTGNESYGFYFNGSNSTAINDTVFNLTSEWIYLSNTSYNHTFLRTSFLRTNGTIFMPDAFILNGSTDINLSAIDITFNRAFVNSSRYPALNISANITLVNLDVINPSVRFADNDTDFLDCPPSRCSVLSSTQTVVTFNVTQFTTYTVNSNCGVLERNITFFGPVVTNTSCFDINASNLIFDCNGFDLSYDQDGIAGTYAIKAVNQTNVTIQNCNIRDINASGSFNLAINFTNVNNSLIFNNTIQTNGTTNNYGIVLNSSNNNTILRNTILTNGSSLDYGILLLTSNDNTFEHNFINTTSALNAHGIYLLTSRRNAYTDTIIDTSGIASYGIALDASSLDNLFNDTLLIEPSQWINSSAFALNNNFTNTTFLNDNGSIRLPGKVIVNVSNDITHQRLNISYNNSFLNSTNLPLLNVSAQITLFNLTFTTGPPNVLIDALDNGVFTFCTILTSDCTNHSYNPLTGTFVFNTTHFTSYRATRPGNFLFFSGTVPNLNVDVSQNLGNVLDLSSFYADPEGQTIAYAVVGAGASAVSVSSDGKVSLNGQGFARGEYDIYFTGSEGTNNVFSNQVKLLVTGPDSNAFPSAGGGGGGVSREDRIEEENETHYVFKDQEEVEQILKDKIDALIGVAPAEVISSPTTQEGETEQIQTQTVNRQPPDTEQPTTTATPTSSYSSSIQLPQGVSWMLYSGLAVVFALFLGLFIFSKRSHHTSSMMPGPAPPPPKTKPSVPLTLVKKEFKELTSQLHSLQKTTKPPKHLLPVKEPKPQRKTLPVPQLVRIKKAQPEAPVKPRSATNSKVQQAAQQVTTAAQKMRDMLRKERAKEARQLTQRRASPRPAIRRRDVLPERRDELRKKVALGHDSYRHHHVKKELGSKRQKEINRLFNQLLQMQDRALKLSKKIEKSKKSPSHKKK